MMADAPLIFEDGQPPELPGVHAIVIGCGHYRHLPGGLGLEYARANGLSQLTSPPHSARHIADWLFKTYYEDADFPLRSLHMLMAEKGGAPTYSHILVPERQVPEATLENSRRAIRDWKKRGDQSDQNLMLLYFCGHGVAAGTEHALLCSDFGEDTDDAFRHAIRFNDFYAGMERCAARSQVFLVDACREASEELMENAASKGQSIIAGGLSFPETPRAAPILRSALPGTRAFGLRNKPSAFGQAFTAASKGAAWRQEAGHWVFCASHLVSGMDAFIRRIMRRFGSTLQPVIVDHGRTLTLKLPKGRPVVPVEIGCDPNEANSKASFICLSEGVEVTSRTVPQDNDWSIDLELGSYDFEATFSELAFRDSALTGTLVFPPSVSHRIGVE